ncbi:HAD family hydrolase [Labrys wisconsinensis]|uniref:FMN phosphatase YigB (HAD superfamily) n=1 Tax=Labrys wisconsinensis TaxID=425677 RepID=A0ABU0J8V4_9HYPH|nr:HAD family hydrolase [Labrys wisconsinensis]MDQ0470712.1 FMN phosphatase YigB (HAD superfamily) [Labrys wisconsinensis]
MDIRSLTAMLATAAAEGVATVSVDIFDTLLLRRCTAPDGVFEQTFLALFGAAAPAPAEHWVQHRQLAERAARRRAGEGRGSPEVTIEEIYAEFPFRLFGLERRDLDRLVAAEFEAELGLCHINPDVAALIAHLRAAGMATGFISDTYWSAARLQRLLHHCQPDLDWDFLLASCDHRRAKADGLFPIFLAARGIAPADAVHFGDNPRADVAGALAAGMRGLHYTLGSAALALVVQQEREAARLAMPGHADTRLDDGLSALRRRVSGTADRESAAALGAEVIGPLMLTFDHFVADAVERLEAAGGRVAVVFLARDGLLPLQVWRQMRRRPADYLEINRRLALVGSATSAEPLTAFFREIRAVDEAGLGTILKTNVSRVRSFFSSHPGGIASGTELVEALQQLWDEGDVPAGAATARDDVLRYFRRTIAAFDACTDLVLVDLGYAGSVQKAIRAMFDTAGIATRLHGVYLLSSDDKLEVIGGGDTAVGMISDRVVTPHAKRILLRNIAVLEQICSAPEGSIAGFDGERILREPDPRSQAQLALCREIRAGALDFVRFAAAAEEEAPFVGEAAIRRAAAILARLLLLPGSAEIALFDSVCHDVNMGTQIARPLVEPDLAARLCAGLALPLAFGAGDPPMWPAASMAALSRGHGHLYATASARGLPGSLFGDVKEGSLVVGLYTGAGEIPIEVSRFRMPTGEIRVRVPIDQRRGIAGVSVPLTAVAAAGELREVVVQSGAGVEAAMTSFEVTRLPDNHFDMSAFGGTRHYGPGGQGRLLVALPRLAGDILVLTLVIAPSAAASVAVLPLAATA